LLISCVMSFDEKARYLAGENISDIISHWEFYCRAVRFEFLRSDKPNIIYTVDNIAGLDSVPIYSVNRLQLFLMGVGVGVGAGIVTFAVYSWLLYYGNFSDLPNP
jgi:hypothetical protein